MQHLTSNTTLVQHGGCADVDVLCYCAGEGGAESKLQCRPGQQQAGPAGLRQHSGRQVPAGAVVVCPHVCGMY